MAAVVAVACSAVLVGCGPPAHSRTTVTPDPVVGPIKRVDLWYRGVVAAVSEGRTLYALVDPGTGYMCRLISRDLITGDEKTLFATSDDINSIRADKNWLVWQHNHTLYAESLKTHRRSVVATSPFPDAVLDPGIEGDWIAFNYGSLDHGHTIVARNLATGESRTIAAVEVPELYNEFLSINKGRILWTDIVEGVGRYRIYDIASRRTFDYPFSGDGEYSYPGYALLSGNNIFSIDFNDRVGWNWTTTHFGRFSLKSQEFTPLYTDGNMGFVKVAGSSLALVDNKQRLLVGPQDGSYPRTDLTSRLGTSAEFISSSDESTIAVMHSPLNRWGCTVWLIPLR